MDVDDAVPFHNPLADAQRGVRIHGSVLWRREDALAWQRRVIVIPDALHVIEVLEDTNSDADRHGSLVLDRLYCAQLRAVTRPDATLIALEMPTATFLLQPPTAAKTDEWHAALLSAFHNTPRAPTVSQGATAAGAAATGLVRKVEDLPFYVGPLDRVEAEHLLLAAYSSYPRGVWLLRKSPRDGKLAITWLRDKTKQGHVKISKRRDGLYRFEATSVSSARKTVLELLEDNQAMHHVVGKLEPYVKVAPASNRVMRAPAPVPTTALQRAPSSASAQSSAAPPMSTLPTRHTAAPTPAAAVDPPVQVRKSAQVLAESDPLRPLSLALEDDGDSTLSSLSSLVLGERLRSHSEHAGAGFDRHGSHSSGGLNRCDSETDEESTEQRRARLSRMPKVLPAEPGYINEPAVILEAGYIDQQESTVDFPPQDPQGHDQSYLDLEEGSELEITTETADWDLGRHAQQPASNDLPPSFQETMLAVTGPRAAAVASGLPSHPSIMRPSMSAAPPLVPATPRPNGTGTLPPSTSSTGGTLPPLLPSTPRPNAGSLPPPVPTTARPSAGTLPPPVPTTARPSASHAASLLPSSRAQGVMMSHQSAAQHLGASELDVAFAGLSDDGVITRAAPVGLQADMARIMATTKFIIDRRFQLQHYSDSGHLMQSVRYAAGGRIHEMRMPSVENRLGGSTNKYIVRDKAGTGLFMVYDPDGIPSDCKNCMHDCAGLQPTLRLGFVNDNLDVVFRLEHNGSCNSLCCFGRCCCLQSGLTVHMQDWEIGQITQPLFGNMFWPVYHVTDSGGTRVRIVGRFFLYQDKVTTFSVQEQRHIGWVRIGTLERRWADDTDGVGVDGFVITLPKEMNMELRVSIMCCALLIDHALFGIKNHASSNRDVLEAVPKSRSSCWPWCGVCNCFFGGCVCRC